MKHGGFLAVLAALVCSAAYCMPKPVHAAPAAGVVAEGLAVTDMAGKGQLRAVKPGAQFTVMLSVSNAAEDIQEYAAVFEIRDANGFTVFLDFSEGLVNAGQAARAGVPAALQEMGNYTVRSFAYSTSLIAPARGSAAFSSVLTAPLSVTDAVSTHQAGVFVPLYEYPDVGDSENMWSAVMAHKQEHALVPFAVTINPWSGPGTWLDPNYEEGTQALRESGIEYVLGYIPTDYARQTGGQTLAGIKAMMDTYRAWYPAVNGVLLDEVNSGADRLQFYAEIADYARAAGFEYVFANPGTRIDERYIEIFDNLLIYENNVPPSVSQLQENTYFPAYSPTYFSFAVKNVPSLDLAYVGEATGYVGFLYLTDDVERLSDPNPYNTLPEYFGELLELLDPEAGAA
jgi:hypothetical protein